VSEPGFACVVPGRLAPTRSPLARLVRRRAADDRQGEALYLAALVVLGAAALLAGQAVWLALPASAWPAWAAGGGVLAALTLGGWLPALAVRMEAGVLIVRRGTEAVAVPLAEARAVRRVSAEEAHAHWRRYAATRYLANRPEHDLLLVRDASGAPVLVGLPTGDLDRLEAAVEAARADGTPVPLAA